MGKGFTWGTLVIQDIRITQQMKLYIIFGAAQLEILS